MMPPFIFVFSLVAIFDSKEIAFQAVRKPQKCIVGYTFEALFLSVLVSPGSRLIFEGGTGTKKGDLAPIGHRSCWTNSELARS